MKRGHFTVPAHILLRHAVMSELERKPITKRKPCAQCASITAPQTRRAPTWPRGNK